MSVSSWRHWVQTGLSLVFRTSCPLCTRPAYSLFCQDCTRKIQACKRPHPWVKTQTFPPLQSWGSYEGALKQSLAQLKYRHQSAIAKPLGQWMAQAWLTHPYPHQRPLFVVPIPLHRDRQNQRGYNQAELIAHSFCQISGAILKPQGLIRSTPTTAQYSLSRQERFQNLQDAFRLGPDLSPRLSQGSILLIDDIFTTGATLNAAATLLQSSGFQVAALLTAAISEQKTVP